ncbi:MAG: DUF4249 domain-containing protein [Chitinophagaceae bacterium]|nr:MAG: DUF4249 domain-containing protein [Chitinophagaceae bacterium]
MQRVNYIFGLLALFLVISCEKPFVPELPFGNKNFLVVDGFINTGADSTIIKISRTVEIGDTLGGKTVTGATVKVESDANEVYTLTEMAGGIYYSPNLNLSQAKRYRVRIQTSGEEVLSDFVESKVSPPIGDLKYTIETDKIKFSLDTSDPTVKSRYYKWDYVETWLFQSQIRSYYKWDGQKVVPRNMVTDDVFYCYPTYGSKRVIIANTLRLAEDVVKDQPILEILSTNERLYEEYSVIVNQRVLTKEAYEFWETVRKTTETTGTIFDVQPSDLTGNIKNIKNPGEPVVGFISAGTVTSKRVSFNRRVIPVDWEKIPPPYRCGLTIAWTFEDHPEAPPTIPFPYVYGPDYYNLKGPLRLVPVDVSRGFLPDPLAYSAFPANCVDCTFRGTNVKPSFFP